MTAHRRAQLARAARLVAIALLSQPVAAALASSALVRYPLVAALMAAAEALVRQRYRVASVGQPAAAGAPTTAPPSTGAS